MVENLIPRMTDEPLLYFSFSSSLLEEWEDIIDQRLDSSVILIR